MVNERRLREKVFAVAWGMWVDEGSPGYCREILSIYANLTNQDLNEVEKEWEKATAGLNFDEEYVDKEIAEAPRFKTKTDCLEWILKNCDYVRGEK